MKPPLASVSQGHRSQSADSLAAGACVTRGVVASLCASILHPFTNIQAYQVVDDILGLLLEYSREWKSPVWTMSELGDVLRERSLANCLILKVIKRSSGRLYHEAII